MKHLFFLLASPLALTSLTYGAGYLENFNGLNNNADLAGQGGWIISGNASNATSDVSYVETSFLAGQTYAGYLGYQDLASGEGSVYLSHSYSDSLVGNTAQYTEFLASIAIFDSSFVSGSPTVANRDSFGITFRNGASNLLTIKITPDSQAFNPDSSIRVDNLTWSGFGSSGSAIPFATMTEGGAGNPANLRILFTPSGVSDVLFTLSSGGVPITSGVLPGAAGENLTNFGFTMNTFSGTSDVGSNRFGFDNLSVVPEPSAALLGLLGASFAMGRRRRA